MAIVLIKELLVFGIAHAIGFGIPPTPNQFACVEVAVVDNPEFVKRGNAQKKMTKEGVEIDGVDVQPIAGLVARRAIVDVNFSWVFAHHAEVAERGVKVLHQVVPCMPLPNHIGPTISIWGEFQDHFRPQAIFRDKGRVTPSLQGFYGAEVFPSDCEDVAVRLHFDVVVQAPCAVIQRVRPQDIVVPRSSFHRGPSTTCPNGVVCEDLWTVSQHDVPVFLEISDIARTKGVCIGPSVNHLSAHVEEVDIGLVVRINKGVAFFHQIWLEINHTDCVLPKKQKRGAQ